MVPELGEHHRHCPEQQQVRPPLETEEEVPERDGDGEGGRGVLCVLRAAPYDRQLLEELHHQQRERKGHVSWDGCQHVRKG